MLAGLIGPVCLSAAHSPSRWFDQTGQAKYFQVGLRAVGDDQVLSGEFHPPVAECHLSPRAILTFAHVDGFEGPWYSKR